MKKLIQIIVILALFAVFIFLIVKDTGEVSNQDEIIQLEGDPIFSWKYESTMVPIGDDYEIEGSDIILVAEHPQIETQEIMVDTVSGGCNEYPEPDSDIALNSTEIICYYAGLGFYFKVVPEGDSYLIQRKRFEEGTPDYNPPQTDFETIATIELQ